MALVEFYRVGHIARWFPAENRHAYTLSEAFDKYNAEHDINDDRRIGAIYAAPAFGATGRWLEHFHSLRRHYRVNGRNIKKIRKVQVPINKIIVDDKNINIYNIEDYMSHNADSYWNNAMTYDEWFTLFGNNNDIFGREYEVLLSKSDIVRVVPISVANVLPYVCTCDRASWLGRIYDFTNVNMNFCQCYDCADADDNDY